MQVHSNFATTIFENLSENSLILTTIANVLHNARQNLQYIKRSSSISARVYYGYHEFSQAIIKMHMLCNSTQIKMAASWADLIVYIKYTDKDKTFWPTFFNLFNPEPRYFGVGDGCLRRWLDVNRVSL